MEKTEPFNPPRKPPSTWSALGLLFILIIATLQLLSKTNIIPGLTLTDGPFPFDQLQRILNAVPSAEKAQDWSAFYTSEPHLPGQGQHQAEWTKSQWDNFGLPETEIVTFDTLLPYPDERQRLALLHADENRFRILHEASLIENVTTGGDGYTPGYFGFSASGNITAQYVYVNFGSAEDFDELNKTNINVEGKIVIMKSAQVSPYFQVHHLAMFRGTQIQNAYARGVAGVLVYPDPQSDGEIKESNGYSPFPDGPARPSTMIERGSLGSLGISLCSISII